MALISLLVPGTVSHADPAARNQASPVRLAAAYYHDDRQFSTLAVSLASTRPLAGFSLWGFTDLHGTQQESSATDFNRSFSEYRLTYAGADGLAGVRGLGIQTEVNVFSPGGDMTTRVGVVYGHRLPWPAVGTSPARLQWRVFPYETDGNGGQLSLIYSLPLHRRVRVGGFADLNVVESGRDQWVIETELNVLLTRRITALLEYRFNGYEQDNPLADGKGVAFGLRYSWP